MFQMLSISCGNSYQGVMIRFPRFCYSCIYHKFLPIIIVNEMYNAFNPSIQDAFLGFFLWFFVPLETYGDVTIAGEGLHILTQKLCSALMTIEQ